MFKLVRSGTHDMCLSCGDETNLKDLRTGRSESSSITLTMCLKCRINLIKILSSDVEQFVTEILDIAERDSIQEMVSLEEEIKKSEFTNTSIGSTIPMEVSEWT